MLNRNKIDYKELDEIVFKHREKNYGAYSLRKNYDKNLFKGLLIASIVTVLTNLALLIFSYYQAFHELDNMNKNHSAYYSPINDEFRLSALPAPPNSPSMAKSEGLPGNTKNSAANQQIQLPDEKLASDSIIEEKIKFKTGDIPMDEDSISKSKSKEKSSGYYHVEDLPTFPGGNQAFQNYIKTKIVYPVYAISNRLSGVVHVSFCINSSGDLISAKVTQGAHAVLDSSAIMLIRRMPKWIPSKNPNPNIKVCMTVFIVFYTP